MPGQPFDAFLGGWGKSQSDLANCATLQNLFLEASDTVGAKAPGVFYPSPGFELFGSVPQVQGKAFFSTAADESRVFAVVGLRLYEYFADGSALERGTVAVDGNPAQISWNGSGGQQLGICAGGNFYCYDLVGNVLTQVVALNGAATQVGFISGYFLVFDILTGTVNQSDLYDGTTFDPANFFQRNVQADDWAAMYVMSWGQIFLPGTKTRDTYYNAGTFPIPFAPTTAGIQPDGCAATYSVKECGKQIAWLGTTAQGGYRWYAATGYEAQGISNKAVDFAFSRYTAQEISSAIGESYSDHGHDFYLMKLPDATWVFDFTTGQFAQWRTFTDAVSGVLGPWKATFHAFGFSKHLWLDADSGMSYRSDHLLPYDIGGLVIQRQRTTPSICRGNQVLDIGELELKCQVGIGNGGAALPTDPGYDPVVVLEISVDGGRTGCGVPLHDHGSRGGVGVDGALCRDRG